MLLHAKAPFEFYHCLVHGQISLRPQFLLAIFNYAIENGVNFELFVMPLIFSHNLLCIVIQMKILW